MGFYDPPNGAGEWGATRYLQKGINEVQIREDHSLNEERNQCFGRGGRGGRGRGGLKHNNWQGCRAFLAFLAFLTFRFNYDAHLGLGGGGGGRYGDWGGGGDRF